MEKVIVKTYVIKNGKTEILLLKLPDNTILYCEREYNNSLYRSSDNWKITKDIPQNAEFIGEYYYPLTKLK